MNNPFMDLLSPEKTDELIASTIKIGAIYKMRFYPEDGITPKNPGDTSRNKFFIVLGVDDEYVYGCVIINSKINVKALTKEAQDAQHTIMSKNYTGIFSSDYSFVDCSRIKPIHLQKMKNASFICHLIKNDFEFIINNIRTRGLISKATLRRFKLI